MSLLLVLFPKRTNRRPTHNWTRCSFFYENCWVAQLYLQEVKMLLFSAFCKSTVLVQQSCDNPFATGTFSGVVDGNWRNEGGLVCCWWLCLVLLIVGACAWHPCRCEQEGRPGLVGQSGAVLSACHTPPRPACLSRMWWPTIGPVVGPSRWVARWVRSTYQKRT